MGDARRVLLVSFFYPPDPAVGGRRVAKFSEYLPDADWEPTVLTAASHGSAPMPEGVQVHATRFASPWPRRSAEPEGDRPSLRERAGRTGGPAAAAYRALRHILPMSSVRMPDATLGWVPYAVSRGRRLLEREAYRAIVSSAGPPSSHLVAGRLQRASGLPWIADYRDLWSDNHWDFRIEPFRRLERRFERRALDRAAALTTVSPSWGERLAELHGKPVKIVYNGFDPDDYPADVAPGRDLVITYVGSLYWPQQDPQPLFAAVADLVGKGTDLDGVGFRLRFLGTTPGPLRDLAERYGIRRWVEFVAPVPYRESLAEQKRSAALLFIGWRDPREGFLSAKIFEYLGSGRPILAIGPPGGDISRILKECGVPDLEPDPATISRRLADWVNRFAATGELAREAKPVAIARYSRRAQTLVLGRLLDDVVASPRSVQ